MACCSAACRAPANDAVYRDAAKRLKAAKLDVVTLPSPGRVVSEDGPRLFEPFVTTKRKGLGIGLYQCRQIIEAHGGRIEVESCVGGGSTFTLWLPGLPQNVSCSEVANTTD